MQILVDTGVLLRAFDRSDPRQRVIFRAMRKLWSQQHDLVTTSQNIAEFWNVSTRPVQARGGFGLAIVAADQRVQLIERLGAVLPFSDHAYVQWRQLVNAHKVIGVSVHDARLVATMIVANIQHILTLNDADFRRYPGIIALTPEDVLAQQTPSSP